MILNYKKNIDIYMKKRDNLKLLCYYLNLYFDINNEIFNNISFILIKFFKHCTYLIILKIIFNIIYLNSFNFTVLEYEQVYVDNLPCCECYEKSYMHRDVITHIVVTKLILIFIYIYTYINIQ